METVISGDKRDPGLHWVLYFLKSRLGMCARAGCLLSPGTLNLCRCEMAVMRPKAHLKVEGGQEQKEAFAVWAELVSV